MEVTSSYIDIYVNEEIIYGRGQGEVGIFWSDL